MELNQQIVPLENQPDYVDNLHPGYKFLPSDSELIVCYLKPKIDTGTHPPCRLHEVNIYDHHPQELAERYRGCGNKWYFLTSRERRYPKGKRPKRSTKESGTWKATIKNTKVYEDVNGQMVGYKRNLVFYEKEGDEKKGHKTDWLMHEYTSDDPALPFGSGQNGKELNKYVLCKLYKKETGRKRDHNDDHTDEEFRNVRNRGEVQRDGSSEPINQGSITDHTGTTSHHPIVQSMEEDPYQGHVTEVQRATPPPNATSRDQGLIVTEDQWAAPPPNTTSRPQGFLIEVQSSLGGTPPLNGTSRVQGFVTQVQWAAPPPNTTSRVQGFITEVQRDALPPNATSRNQGLFVTEVDQWVARPSNATSLDQGFIRELQSSLGSTPPLNGTSLDHATRNYNAIPNGTNSLDQGFVREVQSSVGDAPSPNATSLDHATSNYNLLPEVQWVVPSPNGTYLDQRFVRDFQWAAPPNIGTYLDEGFIEGVQRAHVPSPNGTYLDQGFETEVQSADPPPNGTYLDEGFVTGAQWAAPQPYATSLHQGFVGELQSSLGAAPPPPPSNGTFLDHETSDYIATRSPGISEFILSLDDLDDPTAEWCFDALNYT